MELRHLRYFLAAAQLEHFGRAAKRLAIVQPALSKQIRELEEEVGTGLFERLPRGVRLTPAGRSFMRDAEALLAALNAATERAREVGAGRQGRLRVGFVDTAMYHPVVAAMVHTYRGEFPDVQLDLIQHPSVVQGEMVRAGDLNVGFVFHLPDGIPALARCGLLTERIVLAVPAGHPLAKRSRVGLSEIRDENFVWIPRAVSPNFHDGVFAACARHGFAPRVVQEGQTDLTILSLVAAGVGLSFCVESAAARKPREVVLVDVPDLRMSVRLHAIWRTDDANPALPQFVSVVRRAAASAAKTRSPRTRAKAR